MNATELIAVVSRWPFEPLELRLHDGSRIRVEEPNRVATGRNCSTCAVYDHERKLRFVAYRDIARIVTNAPK